MLCVLDRISGHRQAGQYKGKGKGKGKAHPRAATEAHREVEV